MFSTPFPPQLIFLTVPHGPQVLSEVSAPGSRVPAQEEQPDTAPELCVCVGHVLTAAVSERVVS